MEKQTTNFITEQTKNRLDFVTISMNYFQLSQGKNSNNTAHQKNQNHIDPEKEQIKQVITTNKQIQQSFLFPQHFSKPNSTLAQKRK
jgi:CRISPR/Cas system-associated protein endoribonuclease Cas2